MRMRHAMVVLLAGALAMPALAAEPAKEAPAMTPEQQKMMEAYMKAGTPGPEHARLAKWVGSWDLDLTNLDGPTPQKSKGTAQFSSDLGGRVVSQVVKSDMMGMPFEGHGTEGYDNVAKKYWSVWTDSMSTGPSVAWGTCTEAMCSYEGTYNDAVTGKAAKVRMTIKAESADKQVFNYFGPGPDGKEKKMMEIVYTRKK